MNNIINFLRICTPFIAVIVLWRLSAPFWNPAGVLAIIPIFYSTFVRPTPWFAPFAMLFCFLLDYKFDTVLFWTIMFCAAYAVNGFQNLFDLTRADARGIRAFMIFFGVCVFMLCIRHISFSNVLRAIWMFTWVCALYIPITGIIERARHD